MIPQIQEINFPPYATLHQATVTLASMGERTISTQLRIDGDIVPEFGVTRDGVFYPMELEFKGERFILPIREPQATKDNTTRNSLIDLNFYSWPVYQMKRYFFVEMASISAGTAIADQYIASLALNLENFVTAFNRVLNYYFDGKIQMDLFMAGHGIYSSELSYIDINYSYIWDVLQKVNEIFDIRWWIEYDSTNDIYYIKVGYPGESITDHDFAYGYEGGLLKFERQLQDDNVANILLGRGGEKNLPYRYFKRTDENNPEWAADPDAIPELANIYFDRLRDVNFRNYVQGWRTNTNRDTSWELVQNYDSARGATDWAYQKGHTDEKFNPVEYVKDDESIAKFGEHWGALDNNDEIYPTIQGVALQGLGRVDEVVDISEIVTDDIDAYAEGAAIQTTLRDMTISLKNETNPTHTLESETFTIETGETGNITYRPMSKDTFYPNFVYYDTTRSSLQVISTSTGAVVAGSSSARDDGSMAIAGIPAGTYRLRLNLVLSILSPANSAYGTFGIENVVLTTSATNTEAWKPTFDIWVKNIWQTEKSPSETAEQYAYRVWESILGDRVGNEAKIVFSSGPMAASQDYEFVIASYPEYDTSKSITTKDKDGTTTIVVPSEWKITVFKSDAEYDATGLYLPNAQSAQPVAGNNFFFTGIDMPHLYVVWAEERLNAYKENALAEMSNTNPTWVITLDKVRVHTLEDSDYEEILADRLTTGATVRITDPRFTHGDILTLFVQSITYTWNEPSQGSPYIVPDIEVVLSDKLIAIESPVTKLQNEVEVISQAYVDITDVEQVVRKVAGSLYLKKTGESDTSFSPTAFSSKVTSRNFRKGGVGGRGWGLYEDNYQNYASNVISQASGGRALTRAAETRDASSTPTTRTVDTKSVFEVDKLIVRDEMEVNTLVINQIEYQGGKEIISAAEIEVTLVVDTGNSYVCYFDQKQNSVANLFRVNDIAYGQVWNPDNTGLRYYKMLVTDTSVNSITLSKSVKDGSGVPAVGDVIVQYGNTTDQDRQYVILRDVIGGGYEQMLYGLNSVYANGEEYYFAGMQGRGEAIYHYLNDEYDNPLYDENGLRLGYTEYLPQARWFVGDKEREYAEWIDGVLTIKGRVTVLGADGTYVPMSEYLNDISYLTDALKESTSIQGGLVLSTEIQLGRTQIVEEQPVYTVYAGMSGSYDSTQQGGGIAAWYGGPKTDHEADPTAQTYANSLFRFDGSGYLAGGLLNWGINNGSAYLTLNGEAVVGGLGGVSLNDIANLLFDVVQYQTGKYAVKLRSTASYNGAQVALDGLYTDGFISAGGRSTSGGGGGGGGASYLNDLEDVNLGVTITTGQALVWNGSVWTNGTVTPDLSNYVPTSRRVNGHALTGDITVTASDLGLGNVENTAISTWAGSANLTTLGTITTGIWQGTAIANDYLANSSMTLWGQTATLGGSVTGNLSSVGKITFDAQSSASASGNILEVVNIGTSESPSYALHSVIPFYSDGFISAGGLSSGGGSLSLSLSDLSDVDTTGVQNGNALVYNNGEWTPGTVSGGSGGPEKLFFGTSSTAAGTATKVVTCPEFTASDLVEGTVINVLMTVANSTGSSRKLNVNSTGAVDVFSATSVIWNAYEVVTFVYYNTGWRMAPTVAAMSGGGSGYTLPAASSSALGGVMIYSTSSATLATIIATPESSGGAAGQYRNYPINISSDNKIYVNVPWYGSGGGGGSTVSWGTKSGYTRILTVNGESETVCLNGYSSGGGGGAYLPIAAGSSNPLTGTLYSQSIYPNTTNTYYLGDSSKYWKGLYLGYDSDEGAGVYLEYDSTNKCIRVRNAGLAADGFVSAGGVSGSSTFSLASMSDVDVTTVTPTAGQLLGYNPTTSKWEPIVSTTPTNGYVLVYNSSTKKWVPTNPATLIPTE